MCAKNDLIRRKSLLLTSTPNYVDTFSLDFAFSFITILIRPLIARGNNILSLIAFIISYCLFADKLNIQQSLLDRVTVMLIIILRLIPSTLLAKFIPTTKIRNPLLKKNAAKSRILLACADGRTRQYYLTICAILKHYNFNIHVFLATDTLHLLLKGLVIKMLDFITSLKHFNNKRAFIELIAIVSLLFILKAPFALHFIYAVCDLVTLAQYKSYNEDTLFYSIINKKEYILQIYRTYSIRVTRIQPYLIKLPLSEVAANIAISNFIYAAAQSSSKRHNDPKHYNKKVLYLILIIINYTCYDKDRKHIAYIKAFSKVLLFNNNRQINNTTRMLSILQAFKFYDLSMIICSVHLVLRDLPNLITYTTISYYVNNYID
ncbi:hypothetical protein HBH86_246950 [Parastagonospora nodorum]|nr:hypothetical protein HBH93_247850 [Parastagonospora nodorum]KAH4522766.1 hypothetical protein HBH86_246950 [Parastagonospora nodorum]KAH4840332.1 hypothetical protein HBH58_246880 [Parastagonospora nodorum]